MNNDETVLRESKEILDERAYNPMILCISCFIVGLLRRSQTYIFSGIIN
ncbi:MAG: hypothetical protein SRB1_00333 [Desulfobacteraceae bacterium Eth-SRB1]|nr:MAG: hypothetical protein SRB1_00333 [Desulfobacteraceae bacterium Eth-SRB1]